MKKNPKMEKNIQHLFGNTSSLKIKKNLMKITPILLEARFSSQKELTGKGKEKERRKKETVTHSPHPSS